MPHLKREDNHFFELILVIRLILSILFTFFSTLYEGQARLSMACSRSDAVRHIEFAHLKEELL